MRDVTKEFATSRGTIRTLDEVSLEIAEGELVSLIGPSGCGKSTLLRIVAGLEAQTSGSIVLRHDAGRPPRLAMVFQEYGIFPWKSVLHNVAFGPRLKGCSRGESLQIAKHWIRKMRLDGFENAYPGTLSGGMKQRVGIARALAVDPDVVLFDEPFAALDAMLRELMQDDLLRLWADGRRTSIFATHSLDEAILLADRIALMTHRPGRICEVYEVPFGRPRLPEVRDTGEFTALRARIWSRLRREAAAAERDHDDSEL